MKAYRASILRFDPEREPAQSVIFDADGLLVVGPDSDGFQVVQAVGQYRELHARFESVPTEELPGRIVAPGFVDMHVHFPQTNVIGSPADGLLPWLENHTFPEEERFSDSEYSAESAAFFIASRSASSCLVRRARSSAALFSALACALASEA